MSGPEDLARRAAQAVAGFTSTRSKTPEAMFGGPGGPTHLLRAIGARVETAGERWLLDWTMALGAVALGYAHPRVVEAAARAVRDGAVGPLAHRLEVEIAERVVAAYPGAEQARFFKTGAEAVQAAVRLARVATGRERVVHAGYHGWLDGPTTGPGVPGAAAALWTSVPFDDRAALADAVGGTAPRGGTPPAALLLEPVIERAPSREWLEDARRLADRHGAVLIYDEIKTAFRLARGGAAERWGGGVAPDLAVLGKALANGFPLAAVLGRAAIMARAGDTWISSTLATEFVALAAAGAVLDVWADTDVAGHLARIGGAVFEAAAAGPEGDAAAGRSWSVAGLPEMWFLRFAGPAVEREVLLGCVERGVLLKRGAYNFPSLAHDGRAVEETVAAIRSSAA